MKFLLRGTAANGMPVSKMLTAGDESQVQAYADSHGITVISKTIRSSTPIRSPADGSTC